MNELFIRFLAPVVPQTAAQLFQLVDRASRPRFSASTSFYQHQAAPYFMDCLSIISSVALHSKRTPIILVAWIPSE
jgi:hypothetical protein